MSSAKPYALRAARRGYTPAEDQQLQELRAQGLTYAQIAAAMDRDPSSISGRLGRLGAVRRSVRHGPRLPARRPDLSPAELWLRAMANLAADARPLQPRRRS
jgi:DNA-binding CsgD family transcriptional regulator